MWVLKKKWVASKQSVSISITSEMCFITLICSCDLISSYDLMEQQNIWVHACQQYAFLLHLSSYGIALGDMKIDVSWAGDVKDTARAQLTVWQKTRRRDKSNKHTRVMYRNTYVHIYMSRLE